VGLRPEVVVRDEIERGLPYVSEAIRHVRREVGASTRRHGKLSVECIPI
jgi:hypothetical protein